MRAAPGARERPGGVRVGSIPMNTQADPRKIQAEALLFDNDGTLISSMESVTRCWTRWAGEYGITAEDFGRVELHGRPAAEIVADLLPAERVAEAVARIEDLEVSDVAGGVVALPGTLDLLASLPPERWAVVTSATRRLAEARLGEVGIRPKTLIAADDITRGKPDPEPFLLAARTLGVDPARCVVFEDAPAGLTAGRAAGMTTVALTTTHSAAELSADVLVRDLSEVSAQATAGGVEIVTRVGRGL
ncbi:phosphatase [Streptomyces spectabilis]|nr:phosphatase [Streptomyces spectabilis]